MTDPAYAEEAAAALLRKARDDNEKRAEDTAHVDENHPVRKEIREDRLRVAEGFIALAAIEAGEVTHLSRSYDLPAPETS